MGLFGNLFDSEKRHIHQAEVLADKVLKLEETYAQKSDDDLREVTRQLQEKIQAGASLKDVLVKTHSSIFDLDGETSSN